MKPTKEEKKAINALKRIAKTWPDSLWLFSASGTLCIMRSGEDGKQMITKDFGTIDPAYELAVIDIPNDGGDW